MEAGIDVICDKPMTTTPEDAADLVEAAREYNRFFGVTYTYSFHSMIRQARAMVAGGAIGAVRQAHVEYVQDWATGAMDPDTKQAGWRRNPKHTGRTSVTADIGTHAFHLLSFVLDQPINELSARFHVCGGADNLEDTAFMQLKIGPQDIPGTLWCTQAAAGNACGLRFRIYGDEGGLEWDQEFPEQLHYTPIKQPTRTLFRGKGADILPEAERLIRLPRGHSEGVSDAWCNLYTEMAAAIDARRTGVNLPNGLIQVPDVVDGARGVFFADAAADSHEDNGAWKLCWFEEEV